MNPAHILSRSILTLVALAGVARQAHGQAIPLTGIGSYTQNFDSLTGGTWTNNTTLNGWYAATDTIPDAIPLAVYNGGSAVISGFMIMGDGGTDRALGWRPTTTGYANTAMGVTFQNTSAVPMTLGVMQYTGELWHTQGTANNTDGYQFFYQISSGAPVTNLGPFTVNNGGTYAANAAVVDAGWTRLAGLDYAAANGTANVPLNPSVNQNVQLNMGLVLQAGEYITLRWRNPNDTAGDAIMGIDDLVLNYFVPGASIVYNPAHTVGGAPNGVLEISAQPYWLNGATPTGFANFDSVVFSQAADATVDVPATVTVSSMTVSAPSGTYTIGGAGQIQGELIKSGAGSLVLTGANAFSRITLNDNGTIVAQVANALASNGMILEEGGTLNMVAGDSTIAGAITGSGDLIKIGVGTLGLGGGTTANTFNGDVVVNEGQVVLRKSTGTNAVPRNLIINTGGSVRYSGNNVGNQIADTATIAINGGSFGDIAAGNPTNPGAPETVSDVFINDGGQFSTGRAVFTTTNNFTINSGTATSHRAGTLSVGNTLTVGGTLGMHGGSATAGQESRVSTGTGGLVLNNGTINFNMGSTLAADSTGSILSLSGNVTSTGNSALVRANAGILGPKADVDLLGFDRTFDVTGTLQIGAAGAPVLIQNGGVVKAGPGTLILGGDQLYTQATTINAGTLQINGSLASTAVSIATGGTLSGIGTVAGTVTVGNGGAIVPGIGGTGVLTLAGLTLGAGAADTSSLTFNNSTVPAQIYVSGPNALNAASGAGTISVNLTGDIPQLGQMPLIDYEGVLTGNFNAFTLGNLPNRVEATLVNDVTNSWIALEVSSVDQPVWSGSASTEWSTATIAPPKNWTLLSNAAQTTDFLTNDNVLFNDQGTLNAQNVVAVNVTGAAGVSIGGMRFANVDKPYLITGTSIGGPGGLLKENAGLLTIDNVNSFTGGVTIAGGSVTVATVADAGVDSPLGAGSFISLDGGAVLEVTGAASSTNRALNVGLLGGVIVAQQQVTVSGVMSGNGPLTKAGPGTLALTGANTNYNGQIGVSEGTVQYSGAGIGGNSVIVNLENGATLANNDVVENIFNDANTIARALNIGPAGGTINILNAAGAVLFDRAGGITSQGTITKTGPGILRVRGAHTGLTSGWVLNGGTLEVGAIDALGTGQVIVGSGVLASRNVAVQNPVVMNGGAIGTRSGDLADFQGALDILGPVQANLISYTTPGNSQTITVSGVVSGNGDLTITGNAPQTNGGNKALVLTNTGNTGYTGNILVSPAQFLTAQPAITGNTLGAAEITLQDGGLNVRDQGLVDNGVLAYNNPVTVTGVGSSVIDVSAGAGVLQGNTVQFGTLDIGAQTLVVTGANNYKAAFSGTTTLTGSPTFQASTAELILQGNVTGSFGFTKSGPGQMTVNGTTNFTGPVTVQEGTLSVNGSTVAASDITVQGTGILAGVGTIGGNVTVTAGSLAPDNGAGILSIEGNLTFSTGSAFSVDLPGLSDYDQVNVGGAVELGNATLTLTSGPGVVQNDIFFVLLNDGIDPITGTFAGLSDDLIFEVSGQPFQISYNANSATNALQGGNDIALMAVPEPGSVMLIAGGLLLLAGRRRRD